MLTVKFNRGVVIRGQAYGRGEVATLTPEDAKFAIQLGRAAVYQEFAAPPPEPAPDEPDPSSKKKRGATYHR